MWIETDENSQLSLVLPEGDVRPFDAVILAVPWHQAARPFSAGDAGRIAGAYGRAKSPARHDHRRASLVRSPHHPPAPRHPRRKTFAMDFSNANSATLPRRKNANARLENLPIAAYYQVVISAAHRLAVMEKDALLDHVLDGTRRSISRFRIRPALAFPRRRAAASGVLDAAGRGKATARRKQPRSPIFFWPATGPTPAGPLRWKAPSAAAIWRSKPA